MPELLDIAELGNPVIRTKTNKIRDIRKPGISSLVEDMIFTASKVNGVGLAAPQVHQSISLFIVSSEPNERYPDAPDMKPFAVINPEIIWFSEEIQRDWEGCLSIPGIRGIVPRHKRIRVKYTDLSGQEIITDISDFPARIFQHEFDHLQGIVFLDRIESTADIYTEKEYSRLLEQD